jgi:hypothetical protein
MNATIKTMELIHADNLNPGQLMLEDLIEVEGNIVEVVGITDSNSSDDYHIEIVNDFGEREVVDFKYVDLIPLYVYIETE